MEAVDNDKYLVEGVALTRLIREWKQHGSLVIGLDFDGTVHDFHDEGDSHEKVRQLVRDMHELGWQIVIWTAHKDPEYVAHFCKNNNIPHVGINTDGVYLGWSTRKPFFNALLDDRAGLREVYEDLRFIVDEIKNGTLKR